MIRSRRKKRRAEHPPDADVDAALTPPTSEAGRKSEKRTLTGPRVVAMGAILYAAVWAAFVGGRFVREQRASMHVADESDEPAPEPDPHGHNDRGTREVATSTTTKPRPKSAATSENSGPSLALPNQRWPRIGPERR